MAYPWGEIPLRQAYGIYALGLYADYPDYADLAAEALTEGGDDKDVDFCQVDTEVGEAYVGQCYVSEAYGKDEAPSNKADDLLTGLSWLLNRSLDDVPETLRAKARELQDAFQNQQVERLHLLYVHNAKESDNVSNALKTVASSAQTLLQNDTVAVVAREFGLPQLDHLYQSLTKQIVVEDAISFPCSSTIEEKGTGWRALATTVSGEQLHELWQKYGSDLFSANIRGFLDMLKRKTSINRGILETIQTDPSRFWAFNNGITILTKKISKRKDTLRAQGVSVINGAQTTGVIGNAPLESARKVRVPCRFIECENSELIEQVIECNNTQNAIKSFDFRSNDKTQRRLAVEFRKFNIVYKHRREGAKKLQAGSIQAEVVAPYLAAFRGEFQVAIRQRRTIFEDRLMYGKVFPAEMVAQHVFLIQALADALGVVKQHLKAKVDAGSANAPERIMHEVMKHSTSKFFVAGVIGELAPMIMGRAIPSRTNWVANDRVVQADRTSLIACWCVAVESLLPLIANEIRDDSYAVVRSEKKLKDVAESVSFVVQSIITQLSSSFASIRETTATV